MILGNVKIKILRKKKEIIIEPFLSGLLQYCSYDVRLDKFFAYEIRPSISAIDLSKDKINFKQLIIDEFVLYPQQRCLASTIEQIGSNSKKITSQIAAKSTWARNGLEVCSCAGFGDPGFATHWTLEIYNKNQSPILLKKGMVIAQVFFNSVSMCSGKYKSIYNNFGELNTSFDNEQRFEMILPKQVKVVH
jgi:dCTP deaminase